MTGSAGSGERDDADATPLARRLVGAAMAVIALAVLASKLTREISSIRAESPPLDVECSVPNVSLMFAFAGIDLAMERSGKALVEHADSGLSLLSLPGCRLETILPPPPSRTATVPTVTAGGDLLYDSGYQGPRSVMLKRAGKEPTALAPPADLGKDHWSPVLSDDGRALVWVVGHGLGDGNVEQHLQVRDLDSGSERSIPLDTVRMGYELVAANVGNDDFVLVDYPNRVLVVDGEGRKKWGPQEADAIEHVTQEFRRLADGWVAWDSVRIDNNAVRLQWSTSRGSGRREFPLSSVHSLSVDPTGEWIAVSTSAATRLNSDELLLVLRISDGEELLHRTMPKYSRVNVAFLDHTHLAMDAKSGVDVVRIADSMPARQP